MITAPSPARGALAGGLLSEASMLPDVARMREALVDLGRRRLAHTISETDFHVEREQIFKPYDDIPPSRTLLRYSRFAFLGRLAD